MPCSDGDTALAQLQKRGATHGPTAARVCSLTHLAQGLHHLAHTYIPHPACPLRSFLTSLPFAVRYCAAAPVLRGDLRFEGAYLLRRCVQLPCLCLQQILKPVYDM